LGSGVGVLVLAGMGVFEEVGVRVDGGAVVVVEVSVGRPPSTTTTGAAADRGGRAVAVAVGPDAWPRRISWPSVAISATDVPTKMTNRAMKMATDGRRCATALLPNPPRRLFSTPPIIRAAGRTGNARLP